MGEERELAPHLSAVLHVGEVVADEGVLVDVVEDPVVSSDMLGNVHASVADLLLTKVVDGNLVKVMGWYDNEMGYTYTLVDHVIKTGGTIK